MTTPDKPKMQKNDITCSEDEKESSSSNQSMRCMSEHGQSQPQNGLSKAAKAQADPQVRLLKQRSQSYIATSSDDIEKTKK